MLTVMSAKYIDLTELIRGIAQLFAETAAFGNTLGVKGWLETKSVQSQLTFAAIYAFDESDTTVKQKLPSFVVEECWNIATQAVCSGKLRYNIDGKRSKHHFIYRYLFPIIRETQKHIPLLANWINTNYPALVSSLPVLSNSLQNDLVSTVQREFGHLDKDEILGWFTFRDNHFRMLILCVIIKKVIILRE